MQDGHLRVRRCQGERGGRGKEASGSKWKQVEAYNCHEFLLAGMRIIAKDTTSAEIVVEEEKHGEVGGTIDSKKTNILKKLMTDKEHKDELPVCRMRGGGGPLRRQHHEVFQPKARRRPTPGKPPGAKQFVNTPVITHASLTRNIDFVSKKCLSEGPEQ